MFDLIMKLATWYRENHGIPSFTDEAALRQWILKVFDLAAVVAKIVPGTWDDDLVVLVKAMVSDDEAWAALYEYVMKTFGELPMSENDRERLVEKAASRVSATVDATGDGVDWVLKLCHLGVTPLPVEPEKDEG